MTAAESATAVLAWLGATVVVLAEGRRAMAAGLAAYAVAVGLVLPVEPGYAAALAVAGIVSGALRLRGGPSDWGALPPGATPRIILCIVTGVVGAFISTSIVAAPGTPAARTALAIGGFLATARLLSTGRRSAALTAAATVAVTAGAMSALTAGPAAPAAVGIAFATTIGLGLLPRAGGDAADA